MGIKERLDNDLKEAMRSKDSDRVLLLRGVLAAFKETEQKKRENLVKQALASHNITRPSDNSVESVGEYAKAVDRALAAEKVPAVASLDEGESLSLVQKLIKQRQDSISDAHKAEREDFAQAEERELEVLQSYLPKQLSHEEIEAEAKAIIAQVGASGPRDMGKVMGPLTGKLKGKADGKLISEVVKTLLGS